MMRIIVGLVLALSLSTALAAQDSKQFAPTIRQLGVCQAQALGFQADIMEGKLITWTDVKKELEAKNPSMTLDMVTRTISIKDTK